MTWTKCLWSMLMPNQNEFVSIWLYLIFFLYFFVQLFFIGLHAGTYSELTEAFDFHVMFVATFSIVITLGFTTVYLIFYPLDKEVQFNLESVNYMGVLIFIYFLTWSFVAAELTKTDQAFYFMFLSFYLLASNLVLV